MKIKNTAYVIVFSLFFAVFSVACYIKPDTEFSQGERRLLAQRPELSAETVFSGEFSENFESYAADQFPLRDKFRTLKAIFSTKVLNKADNNGLYFKEGHISKIEYPVNEKMTEHAAERFKFIYDSYIKGKDIKTYISIVPDKNYFLAEKNGYLSIDYEKFINDFKGKTAFAKYIDITHLLDLDDYYRTDSHWRQERIVDVAEHLALEMGEELPEIQYAINTYNKPFYGVYAGQSALLVHPDELRYLTNKVLDNSRVTYYDTGMPRSGKMYNMEKADGKDPYEMFLSGTTPLVNIENPYIDSDRELIIFRDSFGSSLSPLLSQGYKKTTVVDIRYVQSSFLGNLIDFKNQDVLFIYSTTMINNSMGLN